MFVQLTVYEIWRILACNNSFVSDLLLIQGILSLRIYIIAVLGYFLNFSQKINEIWLCDILLLDNAASRQ